MERFLLTRNEAALLIVDIQERLAAAMKHREAVIRNVLHLIEAARLMDLPVIVTEQYPKGLGHTVEEVRVALPSYEPVEKMSFSCCGEPKFLEAIAAAGRKKLIVAGMETHVCVLQSAVDLMKAGYGVHLGADALCSRFKRNYQLGIEFMRDAGAVITSTETVLFQLLQQAGTEEFKAISKRIK
jgi:nicotinamidase-related amidase